MFVLLDVWMRLLGRLRPCRIWCEVCLLGTFEFVFPFARCDTMSVANQIIIIISMICLIHISLIHISTVHSNRIPANAIRSKQARYMQARYIQARFVQTQPNTYKHDSFKHNQRKHDSKDPTERDWAGFPGPTLAQTTQTWTPINAWLVKH